MPAFFPHHPRPPHQGFEDKARVFKWWRLLAWPRINHRRMARDFFLRVGQSLARKRRAQEVVASQDREGKRAGIRALRAFRSESVGHGRVMIPMVMWEASK